MSETKTYQIIDESAVMAEFNRIWPFLEPAAERSGTFGRDHVETEIASGRAQLWSSEDSAIVASLRTLPNGESCIYGWLAGGALEGIQALITQAERWAKAYGCTKAAITCRKGFERALRADGWEMQSIMLVKELQNG